MSDDFLAREAAILGSNFDSAFSSGGPGGGSGGAEIDFDRAAAAFPDIDLDGDVPAPPPASSQNQNFSASSDGFDFDFDQPAPAVKVTGDDELDAFESQFPELGDSYASPPPFAQSQASFRADSGVHIPSAPISREPSAFSAPQTFEEEPEVIKEWRRKQAEAIAAREEAAERKRQDTISKAERAIDEFYEDYNAKKERSIKENKENEAEYLNSLNDSLTAGTTWSRICDYIELQNSQSKTLARSGAGTTDLTRFKEVLLRLRREGDHAPGAAGY
ncbi:hypothetical protein BOTBODRAFT_67652 [Botryobasidium botryosum FD-172 SS1]|uniref:Clathrin light chain n=1 Tax=Botryobasidium botryosum (strain FD-172 SS1) TaxID=930990 RepID=A0A067MK74_BOTB1|nr:hypothetical protein BOTBODRAFT_67652 [Botryobasidium botryosum FD-172 SS1]